MAFHTIIPAGGVGSRLWPLSRAAKPKFLLDLTGEGSSLLEQTVARLAPLADSQTVVTGAAHADAVREQVRGVDVLVEPSMRGTMAAIGLAAALIRLRDPQAVVGSFAADHHISDEAAFQGAVSRAIEAAEAGYVVTIGIEPDSPCTAYGYIRRGAPCADMEPGTPETFSVLEFVEKPDAQRAAAYLATGEYLWNAGMFVAKASVLLDALERFRPDIARPLAELAARWNDSEDAREAAVAQLWDPLPNEVVDRAVAEPLAAEGGVCVVPADMGWSDIGDFASLATAIPAAQRASQVAPGGASQPTIAVDSPGSLVFAHSKPVAVVGIEDAVVIEMDDVILVTTAQAAQQVKDARSEAGEKGLEALL